jgi:superfamily I DNA/RNA helicase
MTPLDQHPLPHESAPGEELGELAIAEYTVFLLAVDTYIRYVSEHQGLGASDDIIQKALVLVRLADRASGDAIKSFFLENLDKPSQKNQLVRAFAFTLNQSGLANRALRIRSLLRRGGPALLNGLFTGSKPRQEVKKAMTATLIDDADAALEALAALPMRNPRLRKWIDEASEFAGSRQFQNPVAAVADEIAEASPAVLDAKVTQGASPGTEQAKQAVAKQEHTLAAVQASATATAAKALQAAGIEDKPATTSEVHGIVAATVAAVINNPEVTKNLPESFINKGRPLDPEQVKAALTDGRVLVAAGAGAGKSTTLVSRISYLINERHQDSGKILACSFNKKAALQLAGKIKDKVGSNNVRVGTMHSLFLNFVVGNRVSAGLGKPEEIAMLKNPRLISDDGGITATAMSTAIRNIWEDCGQTALEARYPWMQPEWLEDGPPRAKEANLYMNTWRGNGVELEQAKGEVKSQAEACAYIWYETYLGIKGDIPGWKPSCDSKAYNAFMKRHRKGNERLGDMEDMQKILLDILRRDPEKRERIQNAFHHILVDEAQDLNLVQHEIFDIMSGKIKPGDGKSVWMIGDDKQCIYQFRGSRPELFAAFADKEGWDVRLIRTNYRCEPEIVEAANRLQTHNKDNIKMECKADPKKAKGSASIVVEVPEDSIAAAVSTITNVVHAHKQGEPLEKFAVLTRTNKELNEFETACIIGEIKYVKKSGKGFLDAPESRALLGYIDLVRGDSYETMKQSLVAALLYPNRGLFMGAEDAERCVDEAIRDVARFNRVDKTMVNPAMLLEGRNVSILADALKRPNKVKIVANAKSRDAGEFMYQKRVEELADNLEGLASDLRAIDRNLKDNPTQPTSELLNSILDGVSSTVYNWDPDERRSIPDSKTLREYISANTALFSDPEEEEEEEKTEQEKAQAIEVNEDGSLVDRDLPPTVPVEGKGLGSVQFLFQLAIPNANDAIHATDPSTSNGFIAKIARYRTLADKLRIDPKKWELEHKDEPAPAITLSTVHKVKGAEWEHVVVMMPKGTFPMELKMKKGDPPPDPVKEKRHLEAERNLAYVAITRAQKDLKIVCPKMLTGGKEAGISPFVGEAGLVPGENVQHDSIATTPEVTEAVTKLASVYDDEVCDVDAQATYHGFDGGPPGNVYDRRRL